LRIFITRSIPEEGIKFLRDKKFKLEIYKKDQPIPRSELIKKIKNIDGIISLLTEKFDKELIDDLTKCKIIANMAVGYNNIDVHYARSKGIIVTNTPDVLTDSTADLSVALLLAAARRIGEGERMVRSGKFEGWKPNLLLGIELKNKIVGILGAGRIGTEFAERISAFKTKIIYYDTKTNFELERKTNAGKVSLNYLLKYSDFISIHLPLTNKTYHILNKGRLSLLKESCILVNTSRGEIIDEKELLALLKSKKILAAGLDVYENEPGLNKELIKLDNVVLLPHIGSATIQARNAMSLLAAKNVAAVLSGENPITPVL
jgi:glyoxylate reductase